MAKKATTNKPPMPDGECPPADIVKTPRKPIADRVGKPAHIIRQRGMTGDKHVLTEPTDRDVWIYRQWVRRVPKSVIARQLGLGRESVYVAIRRVREHLRAELWESITELREEHTASLEHIAAEAMDAWRKSKKPGVVETETEENGGSAPAADGKSDVTVAPRTKKHRQTTYQVGNVAYLDQAQSALKEIRQIWGVDAKPGELDGVEGVEADRVAGVSRSEAIRRQIDRLQEAIQQPGVN